MGKLKFLYIGLVALFICRMGQAQGVSEDEHQALIELYNATNGANWTNNTNWNTGALVEDWYGVTVVNGNVTSVDLENNGLTGTIPGDIIDLVNMTKLDLKNNSITGSIPSFIGNMTALENLNLSENMFSGSIPTSMGQLSNLRYLNLWDNNLTGTIPSEIGSATNLVSLYLGRNNLTGTIPTELGGLGNLTFLSIQENSLTGIIPSELGNLSNLKFAYLSSNQFSGSIPSELGNLSNLIVLFLGLNQLSGVIPPELGSLTNLEALYLNNNQLSGSIPPELGNLSNLNTLTLHFNNLTGTIPIELGNLSNLNFLGLSNNQLTGNVPTELGSLTGLDILYLGDNNFTGDIPSAIAQLPLSVFRISTNGFVFSNFESEYNQYAGFNEFLFSPQAKVDQEETLTVDENGSITLTSTDLTSTNNSYQWYKDGVAISGATSKDYVISNATAADAGVYYFEATNSVVTGLTLTRNDITLNIGTDPCGVSAAEKQALLDLYNATDGPNWTNTWDIVNDEPCDWYGVNVLAGGIITTVDLSDNNLSGTIPGTIGQLTSLIFLNLDGNQLTGGIPSEIGQLSNLSNLDLSRNSLTGTIPVELGQLTTLDNLSLGTNNLSGSIPSELSQMSSLRIISLVNNNLTGSIPSELGLLSSLETINLNDNGLSGSIPLELSQLPNLRQLYLRSNQFSGDIPNNFVNLSSLVALLTEGNNFVFSNFENEHVSYINNLGFYDFSPQAKVDQEETLTVDENGSITLTSTDLTSTNNSYQWYKDGVAISGATSKDYVISNATAADAGVYYFEATNSVVTGLTLTRNDITLNIGTDPCGVSVAEKQALLDLYNATDGPNWTNTWDIVNDEPCDWYGVTVVNGDVVSLSMQGNNMVGSIPTSIGNLANLSNLSLNVNQLTGSIPTQIGNLILLVNFDLANNQLTGTIPSEIGNLTDLTRIAFFQNQLSGSLPSTLGNLILLEELDLGSNQFSGILPTELGNLNNLVEIYFSNNQFSGPIPPQLGDPSLSDVGYYFDNNQFSGTLPDFTGMSPQQLIIENNSYVFSDFESEHPTYANGLTQYTYSPQAKVDLEETQYVAEGASITLTSTALTSPNNSYQWYKDGVAISGATSKDYVISNATATDAGVYYFEATNSVVTGLTLTRNDITLNIGTDPCGVSAAEKQALLDLYNATDGPNWTNTWDIVNDEPCDWYGVTVVNGNVTELSMPNNLLDGAFNTSISGLLYLEQLNLSYNNLSGILPTSLTSLQNLTVLNLRNNGLSGQVPTELGNLSGLQELYLNYNQFTGNIPTELSMLTSITKMDLGSNQLTGNIPTELGQLNTLMDLRLYYNNLSGNIPNELTNLTELLVLDLINNSLTGNIPVSIGNLSKLERLSLTSNNLTGPIPVGISTIPTLIDLSLGNNNLSGQIPSEIASLTNLNILAVNGNNLIGSIPISFSNLSSLGTLNIISNNLSGEIPSGLSGISGLHTLLVNNNNLEGDIADFSSVAWLEFRNNKFHFEDFEDEHLSYTNISPYAYSPQAKVDVEETISVQEFSSITLNSNVLTSTNNSYQWYKDGVAIAGATSKDYVIPNATATDAGVYHFEATNSVVTGLTLTRNDITLNIESGSNTIVQQQFCTTDGVPTVADLSVPTPTGVSSIWYSVETGGTPLDQNETLQNGNTYWRDYTGNTEGRAGVVVNIDNLIPIGNPIQEFDAPANPTLADIAISLNPSSTASQVQWYASATSTTALANTTALQDGVSYFAAENATTCRLEIRVFLALLDVCIDVVHDTPEEPNALYGNFEGAADAVIANSRNQSMGSSGWTITLGTPDTFSTPYSNTTDSYLQSSFTASPNGDICAGGLRFQNTAEAFGADIYGLNASTTYVIEFYAANVSNVVNDAAYSEAFGFWEINFAGTTMSTSPMAPSIGGATTWQRQRLEFDVNSSATQFMEFKVGSNATDQNNAYPVYMLIDGIRVYEKPQSTSSNPCAIIEPQVFCNSDDDNPPTIGDLTSPSGNSVTWHSAPIDGTRYFESVELGSISETFVWADEGNGEARVPVEILLDFGAPFGDTHQSFDGNDSPTLADLVVEGTNITWHSSYASIDVLPTSTPLTNDAIYYAAQDGNPCRLSVQVFVGIPTLVGDGNQEFCGSTDPTVGDLVMETTDPSYTLTWYDAETGGLIYNSTDSLVDGETYYASQTDGINTNEERYPVRISIIDTSEENKLYERDILIASSTTIADLTTFFELDASVIWYDFPQGGTAYPNTYTLIDGETYYARISEGLCDALEVLAATVSIENVTTPELVSCIKFIPQPGDRYVISGWVREHAATPVPTNTLEFTEKESFIALLDHLTSKILNMEQIPPVYELHKDPQAPNVNALLPFIKNYTGTNVTVYDFQFETEQIGVQQVAVGYSFALAPDNLYRFVYRTPLVAYQFNSPSGGFSVVISEDYRNPLLNYGNLEIEYTDVDIVGNSFRITSNFNMTGVTDSEYKTSFTGHTTDSDTDSGIEANVQLFDYVEEPQHTAMDYLNTSITLEYLDENGQAITLADSNVLFEPKGAIIDGWQRISGDFTIPSNAANMKIYLKNDGSGLNAYFDDVRMHPFDSNMKSFVYDPFTQRLQAELDENNYATFYEYDSEGGLVRVKKETERGVYTIQETRSGNSKLNNGSD